MSDEDSFKTMTIRPAEESDAADSTLIIRGHDLRSHRMFVVLRVVSGSDLFRVCAVHPHESILVGRSESCDLVLKDPSVSRRHASVTLDGDSVVVEDLESSNGTVYLQDRIRQPVRVEIGAEIVVGNIALKIDRLGMEELTRFAQIRSRLQDADIDPLSGVLSRRYLDEALPIQVESYTQADAPITICFLDVDRFKTINDTHGHLTGDRVLCRVADLLRSHVRSSDDVVRYGGDEFLLVLPYCDEAAGLLLGERICRDVEALEWDSEESVSNEVLAPTVSVGVAQYRHEGIQDWLAAAERALYRAKHDGRNTARASSEESR